MKFKASVDYGVRAVIYLAMKGGTCSSREISEEMSVPRDYLIQLALRLRNAGIIKAQPGKNGGYALAKKPSSITIGQIMDAFDNDLKHARQEIKRTKKTNAQTAAILDIHNTVMHSLDNYLNAITIQDLIDSHEAKEDPRLQTAVALEREAARLRSKLK